MDIKVSEIEESIREIFKEEEGKAKSIDLIYELSDDEKFYKLIFAVHEMTIEDTVIIHTKFIFRCDLEKNMIIENEFIYLYEINCIFHKIQFESSLDTKNKIKEIIESNNFGENIRILSDFICTNVTFINHYLKRAKVYDYSVFDSKYSPKFKNTPCSETTFDFTFNINNNYSVEVSLKKKDDEENKFVLIFKFMDDQESSETDTLQNIHYLVGTGIAKILNKKLKNSE